MTTLRKPAWWQLYALVAVLGGLFPLEHRATLAPSGHIGVQAGIICVIYGLVWRWLRTSAYALMAAPTLYHRHDYYGHDADDWPYATKVDGMACNGMGPHGTLPTGPTAVRSHATAGSSVRSRSARTLPDHGASALGPRQPSPVA
jgi:hypothetical protein